MLYATTSLSVSYTHLVYTSRLRQTEGTATAMQKKAKTVHCNFVMDETYHQNLKLIAISKGDSLKSVLQEAISDYLDKNSSLLSRLY